MRLRINFFGIGHNKDAVKEQLTDAFAARDFQLVLAFLLGAFVALMAFAAATHRF